MPVMIRGNKKPYIKLLKRLLIAGTILIVLVSLFIYIFGDEIKEKMLVQLKQSSGLSVNFEEADLTFWSTFPYLTLNTKQLDVSPDSSFAEQTSFLLQSDDAYFSLDLLQLLSGKIQISGMQLKDAVINLKQKREIAAEKKMFPEVLQDLEIEEAVFNRVRLNYLSSRGDTAFAFNTGQLKVECDKNDSSIY
ncbi:MAG: hypothetical protein ACOC2E_09405, partial [Bacteroidota bacterium]